MFIFCSQESRRNETAAKQPVFTATIVASPRILVKPIDTDEAYTHKKGYDKEKRTQTKPQFAEANTCLLLHGLKQVQSNVPLSNTLTGRNAAVVAHYVWIHVGVFHATKHMQSTLPLLTLFQRTDCGIVADDCRSDLSFGHAAENLQSSMPLPALV